MLTHRLHLFLFSVSLLIASYASLGKTVVCRNSEINGFEIQASHAKKILPNQTRDPRKAAIYIENTANGLYFHSNFISQGAQYPTKIVSDEPIDGANTFANIMYDISRALPSNATLDKVPGIYENDVKIFLNTNMFDKDGVPLVDLGSAKNVVVVDNFGFQHITDTGMETLSRNKPPPLIMKKIGGCCFFGIPPHLAARYAEALRARKFQVQDVRFLSLVHDSATESAISKATYLQKSNLRKTRKFSSLTEIEEVFKEAKGKTVVLIGHVEGENFVTRNAKNEILLSVSIHALRASAARFGIELIDLGCRTAQQISKDSLKIGVTTRFNTVEAVNSVNHAMSSSKNYEEFFENLTAGGMKIVVDREFDRSSSLRGQIYSSTKKSSYPRFWVPVADVFVTFRNKKQ